MKEVFINYSALPKMGTIPMPAEIPESDYIDTKQTAQWGVKFDDGKIRYDLLPPEFLEATADILAFGANKYGERNWEKGMNWSRAFAALMRHMWAWWRGQNVDEETRKSHLWHAACCLAFLITYEQRDIGKDDRPITNS